MAVVSVVSIFCPTLPNCGRYSAAIELAVERLLFIIVSAGSEQIVRDRRSALALFRRNSEAGFVRITASLYSLYCFAKLVSVLRPTKLTELLSFVVGYYSWKNLFD